MTIVFEGVSSGDQSAVNVIWAELMRVLDKPAGMNAKIDRWFGAACPAAFRTDMPKVLRKFRSNMNLCSVTVCCSALNDRDIDTFGAAYHNIPGGFAPITNFNPMVQPSLRLELDSAWHVGVPMYKTPGNSDSALQTIAHELSHLLLATKDHPLNPPAAAPKCYGAQICLALAANDDARALTNADNWGYFIEDLRR